MKKLVIIVSLLLCSCGLLPLLLTSCTNIVQTPTDSSSSNTSASSSSVKDSVQILTRAQLRDQWGVTDSFQAAADSLKILMGIHFGDTSNAGITDEIDSIMSHYQSKTLLPVFVESLCDLTDTMKFVRENETSSTIDAYGISNTVSTYHIWIISFRGDTIGSSIAQYNQRYFYSEGDGSSLESNRSVNYT